MRSSDPNFYSSSSSDSSSLDDDDNSGLNQIINGVKNSLNLSRSKSNKSDKSGGKYKSSKQKPLHGKEIPYNNIRPLNGTYNKARGDYSSNSDDSDSSSESSGDDSDSESGSDNERSKQKNGDGDKGNESTEDYSDDEDEGEDGYKVGGYHRVKVGEVYNQRLVFRYELSYSFNLFIDHNLTF